MREIEIKARVANKEGLLSTLQEKGIVLGEPITQRDQVYGLTGADGGNNNHAPWLRIRTETKLGDTKHIFTLKKSITGQLDSIEHETEIEDESELENIILHLGFEPYSDLTKLRQKSKVGEIEICVDVIDMLGSFIEVEKLTDEDADYKAVADELWTLLEDFGITHAEQVTDGYDVLMRKHLGLDA